MSKVVKYSCLALILSLVPAAAEDLTNQNSSCKNVSGGVYWMK
jgi:hypothetical protein